MSALAASIRNFGLLVRAGGPRRNQASSLRIRFAAALLGDRRQPVALGPGQDVRRIAAVVGRSPSPSVHLPRQRGDLVEEPAVVRDRDDGAPGRVRRVARWSASQATPSTSRWLVGSSRSSRSGSPTSSRGEREPATLAAGQWADDRVEPADAGAPMPPRSPVEDVADACVPGPHVLGQVADDRLADRPRRVQRVDLGEHADRGPARAGDAAGIRPLGTGEHPQQSGLAAAVAPDDADPVAGCRRRGRPRRARGGAETTGRRSRGRRGWPCAQKVLGRLRPAMMRARDDRAVTAPLTGGPPATPAAERATPRSSACFGRVDQERDGRPGPGDDAAERAVLETRASDLPELRAGGRSRRGCRSLRQRAPEGVGVAGAQRGHHRRRTRGLGGTRPCRAGGRTRRRPSGWRARRR